MARAGPAGIARNQVRQALIVARVGDRRRRTRTLVPQAELGTARYWLLVPPGRASTRMSRHQRIAADEMSRSPWVIPGHGNHAGKPYGYQAMWRALRALEERAGVEHRPYRALHGFRKMV